MLITIWIAECCEYCKNKSEHRICVKGKSCSNCINLYKKGTRRLGSFLLHMLYGGSMQIVNTSSEELEEEEDYKPTFIENKKITTDLSCLHCILASNAITFITLLFVTFFDRYIIACEFGCVIGKDCYLLDDDPNEFPIKNCSLYEQFETKTICFSYNLKFLDAMSDLGGILVMTILMNVLMTKLIICGLDNCCNNCARACCCYIAQITTAVVVIAVATGYLILIHSTVIPHFPPLRLTSYIFQYITILLTFALTTLTPWFLLSVEQDHHESTNHGETTPLLQT